MVGNILQIGIVKFRSGDFRFQYENDGTPFQKIGTGDGGDSYRTSAAGGSVPHWDIYQNPKHN